MWNLRWRRNLFECEYDTLNVFISWINRFPLQRDHRDTWKWSGDMNGTYSIKGACTILSNQQGHYSLNVDLQEGFKTIWNKVRLIKVIVHAWRILWDRLPTIYNLHR